MRREKVSGGILGRVFIEGFGVRDMSWCWLVGFVCAYVCKSRRDLESCKGGKLFLIRGIGWLVSFSSFYRKDWLSWGSKIDIFVFLGWVCW